MTADGRGSRAALRKKILKASDPDGKVILPPSSFSHLKRKTEEQLCPSLRPSEGQIQRGRSEAARGDQPSEETLICHQARGNRLVLSPDSSRRYRPEVRRTH